MHLSLAKLDMDWLETTKESHTVAYWAAVAFPILHQVYT
ncbi:MAG: hypothetical protein ACI97A_003601 [Planctomycetota bacterium]